MPPGQSPGPTPTPAGGTGPRPAAGSVTGRPAIEPGPGHRSRPGAEGPVGGLALAVVGVALAWSVHALLPAVPLLTAAVVLGIAAAHLPGIRGLVTGAGRPGLSLAGKRLMRLGIVLLGLKLGLDDVLGLGWATVAMVFGVVAATFLGTWWLGGGSGLRGDQPLLIATGYSICGASAIGAVSEVSESEERDVATVRGPGHAVRHASHRGASAAPAARWGLDAGQFGRWVGASVHDVGQVVATAQTAGPAALGEAVLVKLMRVALLAPLVAALAVHRAGTGARSPRDACRCQGRRPATAAGAAVRAGLPRAWSRCAAPGLLPGTATRRRAHRPGTAAGRRPVRARQCGPSAVAGPDRRSGRGARALRLAGGSRGLLRGRPAHRLITAGRRSGPAPAPHLRVDELSRPEGRCPRSCRRIFVDEAAASDAGRLPAEGWRRIARRSLIRVLGVLGSGDNAARRRIRRRGPAKISTARPTPHGRADLRPATGGITHRAPYSDAMTAPDPGDAHVADPPTTGATASPGSELTEDRDDGRGNVPSAEAAATVAAPPEEDPAAAAADRLGTAAQGTATRPAGPVEADPLDDDPDGATVLGRRFRALTLGIVSVVSLIAFEASAVNTAMPVAAPRAARRRALRLRLLRPTSRPVSSRWRYPGSGATARGRSRRCSPASRASAAGW